MNSSLVLVLAWGGMGLLLKKAQKNSESGSLKACIWDEILSIQSLKASFVFLLWLEAKRA